MRPILLGALLIYISGTGICLAEGEMPGKRIFADKCSHCHAPGYEQPGTRQLGMTRGEEKAVLEQRKDLTADYIRYIVRHGINAMPAFVPTDVSPQQLDELIRYLVK